MSDSTSKDLIIKEISNSPLVKKEYKNMLANIRSTLPAIKKTSSNFYKSHSQFMGVMLDVTAITPVRLVWSRFAKNIGFNSRIRSIPLLFRILKPKVPNVHNLIRTVYYTHLRAHETGEDLRWGTLVREK